MGRVFAQSGRQVEVSLLLGMLLALICWSRG